MRYQFYVNVEKDECGRNVGFFGYKPGHALELGYTGEIDASEENACEVLFVKFNIDFPTDYHWRSMSVGDVVVLNGTKAFACAIIGFQAIDMPLAAKEVQRV